MELVGKGLGAINSHKNEENINIEQIFRRALRNQLLMDLRQPAIGLHQSEFFDMTPP